MEFHPLIMAVPLALMLVLSHAALPAERYWDSILPNAPMPRAVTDLLQPEGFMDEKSTDVSVGKGGVNVQAGKGKPGGTSVNVGKGGVNVHAGKGKQGGGSTVNVGGGRGVGVHTGKPGRRTNVGVGKGGVSVHTGKPGKRTNVGVGKGGVSVHTGHKGKPVSVNVKPGANPFQYRYAANENQLRDNPNIALFFLTKDLTQGRTMGLQFTEASNGANFLPRQVADSVPFSSNKLPQILRRFSVEPGTIESEIMKKTIDVCEAQGNKGEEKYCATSLESMIDFSISKLGKEIHAVSTEVDKRAPILQTYTIAGAVKKLEGDESVVCHKLQYAYAVFYCHKTEATSAYMVPLVGADGTQARAVAICHKDTSAWNPKHLAFQVLKVKPGTVPVCHFLPQDHIVWVQN